MKKITLLIPLVCLLAYVILSSNSGGAAAVASLDCTGVMGPSGGCGGPTCHGTAPSDSIVCFVDVLGPGGTPVTSYVPYTSYTIRVKGINSSYSILPQFGYQLTVARYPSGISAGTYPTLAGSHVTTLTPTLKVCEQSYPLTGIGSGGFGTIYQVNIPWVAPPPGAGLLAVRAIVNAVNGSGTASAADHWPAGGWPLILPEEPMPTIYGTLYVCAGGTTSLGVYGTSGPGSWVSMDTSIASISTVGVVSGVSPGVATIYYASSFSYAFATVTVDPMPVAIAGIHAVCQGGTSTLTDATAGGTWISSDPSVAIVGPTSGVVSGAAATGTATITYKTPLAGCAATTSFTVALSGSVTGVSEMCAGNSSGFMHTFGGGIWYSSNPSAATVNTSGLVTGVAAGTSVISYSLSTTGCDAEQALTVNARPVPSVAGSSSVCLGYTTTLTGTPAGGTWLSTDVSKATINASTGVITGMANGTATMKYFVTGSCGMDSTTTVVTVKSAAPCVNGVSNPFALAEELKVFPNPSKGAFSLNVLSATDDVAHIVITNIVGEKVKEFTLSTNAINSISLGQPAGIYFLSATTLNSKYFVKIVVE